MLKENLERLYLEAQDTIQRLESKDEKIREEFAKAFGWYKVNSNSSYQKEERDPRLPSWEEIFIQVGRLLNEKNFSNISKKVLDNSNNIEMLLREIGTKEPWEDSPENSDDIARRF